MGPEEADGSSALRGLNPLKSSVKIYVPPRPEPHSHPPTHPNCQAEVKTKEETKEQGQKKTNLVVTRSRSLLITDMTFPIYLSFITCFPQHMYMHAHTLNLAARQ